MSKYQHFFLTASFATLLTACGPEVSPDAHIEEWEELFNGENLDGWTPKFNGYLAGENFNNTFQAGDGILSASYAGYDTFSDQFGHLFYQNEYSYYKLQLEYRFVGDQVAGGAGWAFANNGIMLHCQPVETMSVIQGFPLSVEFQFLGGNGTDPRPSGSLCTPGSHVTFDGVLYEPHCMIDYEGPTYHSERWVGAEAVVYGDSIIHHILESDTVLTYSLPVVGGDLEGLDKERFPDGMRMTKGYFALQAESHGADFRNIRLLNLCGCTDKKASNYKSYYVKSDPASCTYN